MKAVVFLFILIACQRVNGKLTPLNNDYSQKHFLSKCLVTAVRQFAGYGVLSVVISSSNPRRDSTIPFDNIFLDDISKDGHVSYISKKVKNLNVFTEYTKQITAYLLRMRTVLELETSLELLTKDASWNPHAKFFIVSTYQFRNTAWVLSNVSEIMWQLRLLNYVVLFSDNVDDEIFNVYTGFPYGGCGIYVDVRLIDHCINGKFKNRHWFMDKIPRKLNGCPFYVGTTIIAPFVMPPKRGRSNQNGEYTFVDGFEIKLLNTIADYINMPLNYTISDTLNPYTNVFANGSVTGAFQQLNEREIDLVLGYVVSTPETQQIFDVITSYSQDSLVFCVAQAKRLHGFVTLTKNLDNAVLFILVSSLIVVSTLVYIASHVLSGEIVNYKRYREVLTNTFLMMIGSNVRKQPNMIVNRMIVIFWMISSYWFQTQYVTIMMNALSKHHTGYQISVLDDILRSNMTIQYYHLCSDYLRQHKFDKLEKWECINYKECLNKTALDIKFATCISEMNVQYLLHNFIDYDGYPMVHCFEERIVTYPIQMLMWKGHPLKTKINDFVNRLSAGGFVYKWKRDIFYEATVEMKAFVPSSSIVLKLSQLSIALILLGVCYPLTLVVFVVELVAYRFRQK